MRKSTPELPPRLPIKLEPTSNGEYDPPPLSDELRSVQRLAFERCADNARRLGISRREYLRSTCGAATVLLALNKTAGCGSTYNLTNEAPLEPAAASAALEGDEFVFDVQTHHVSDDRPWWEAKRHTMAPFLKQQPDAQCGRQHWSSCFAREPYMKEIFLDSDTDLAVLSALWGTEDMNPTHIDEAARTRDVYAELDRGRLRIHGAVLPKAHGPERMRDEMQALAETWRIDAWKLYPVWGPQGRGYRLDDAETGMAAISQGLDLGVSLFAVHKGLPLGGMDPSYTRPDDVGPVARAFPGARFLIYHSGYEADKVEGPYDPKAERGVDVLIRSLEQHGIGKGGNVWAELGSLWREVMKSPDQAAHVLGKLLKHVGEDRILWGTDAIWYGSPQDQIQAFRAFEIPVQMQERYGYPALTKARKAKILGLNAADVYGLDVQEIRRAQKHDKVTRAREEYRNDRRPSHRTYGPRTRAERVALSRRNGGLP